MNPHCIAVVLACLHVLDVAAMHRCVQSRATAVPFALATVFAGPGALLEPCISATIATPDGAPPPAHAGHARANPT
jgi:hypothetical protein